VSGGGRLIRLAVALYPRDVRDRYGPEIADLLAHSQRPVRDLADVARCALAERARLLSYPRLRPYLHATAGLLVAPAAFAGFYLAFVTACSFGVFGVAAVGGWPVGSWTYSIVMTAATLLLAAGSIWLAGHTELPFTPVLAPTGLAAGALLLAPLIGTAAAWPTAAAIGTWWVTMSAASTLAAATVRRGSRRRPVLIMTLGGTLASELAFTMYGLAVFGSPAEALGLYPVAVLGIDPRLIGDPGGQVTDALTILPALLTVCTAYALWLATATHRMTAVVGCSQAGSDPVQ
jgi:hypothetical protein